MVKSIINISIKGKRETIMHTAFELFFTKGYNNTKIIEIAEAANIGKGTFYEYFKSKDALLEELLRLKFDSDQQQIDQIAASDKPGTDKIRSFFEFEIQCIEDYGPSSNVLFQEMMSPTFSCSDEIKLMMHKIFMHKYNFVNQVIKEGIEKGEFREIDSALAATSLIGAISFYTGFKFNIMHHHVMPGIPFGNPAWDNEEFFELVFSGLK